MLISPAVVSAVEGYGGLLQRSVVREVLIGEGPVSMVTRDYLSKQPVDSLIDWIVNFDDYPHPDIIGWLFKYSYSKFNISKTKSFRKFFALNFFIFYKNDKY